MKKLHIFTHFRIDKIKRIHDAYIMKWGNLKEIETKRRINLAVWAYAYEFQNHSIVSDAVYDYESYMVNLSQQTGRPDLDFWFVLNFDPSTGLWIHKHPELNQIAQLYKRWYSCKNATQDIIKVNGSVKHAV